MRRGSQIALFFAILCDSRAPPSAVASRTPRRARRPHTAHIALLEAREPGRGSALLPRRSPEGLRARHPQKIPMPAEC